MNESEFPALYEAADTASKNAQRYFLLALGANLIALVVAAALTVADFHDWLFAFTQSIVLIAGLFITIYLAVRQPQKIWYGTRALAESIKTVTWRYVMRAEPFDVADMAARGLFIDSVRKIFEF